MIDQPSTDSHRGWWIWPAAIAAATPAAAVGLWLSLTSPELPGTEALTFEDAVDAAGVLLFGVLGAALVVRGRAAILGKALVLMASMVGVSYLFAGLADALADGLPQPADAARLLNLASQAAFVVAFFLISLAPAFLFPTGRLPSRRWRWVAGAGALGCLAAVLSIVLAPGAIDEDVPAWGDNPIGLQRAVGLVDALETIGLLLLAVGVLSGLAAFVSRWVRYRGARRRQMAWLTIGIAVQLTGRLTDTSGDSVAIEVTMAAVIFGSLLWGIGWPLLGPLGAVAEAEQAATSANVEPVRRTSYA